MNKKTAYSLIVALVFPVALGTLTGCCTTGSSAKNTALIPGTEYKAVAQECLRISAPDKKNRIVQGGYFSGRYYYIAFFANDETASRVLIAQYDKQGNQIAISEPLELDHANNITYNSKKKLFLVSHCQAKEKKCFARYSFVDPKTLTIVESGELPKPFFAMGYCSARDTYVSGEWGGQFLDSWNGDLSHIGTYPSEQPKTVSQGVWSEKDYTWFVRSERNGFGPELRLYAWKKNNEVDPKPTFVIPIENMVGEPENITVNNGQITCIANNENYTGAIVYTLTIVNTEH